MFHGLRMRKHWRYVEVWSPSVSICATRVRVGPLAQEFWGHGEPPRFVVSVVLMSVETLPCGSTIRIAMIASVAGAGPTPAPDASTRRAAGGSAPRVRMRSRLLGLHPPLIHAFEFRGAVSHE